MVDPFHLNLAQKSLYISKMLGSATASEEDQEMLTSYLYKAPWPLYALSWSKRIGSDAEYRLAIGSYVEEYRNKVQVS